MRSVAPFFLPSYTHVPLDFPGQPPQVLSHLLLVVKVFPLLHPCAIRFPSSNRQIPTSPISSSFSGRWPSRPFWAVKLLGRAVPPCAIRFPRSNRQIPTSPISSYFSGRWPSRPFWVVKLWGRAVPSASPKRHKWETQRRDTTERHNGWHLISQLNCQISRNLISSAFSGRKVWPEDFDPTTG